MYTGPLDVFVSNIALSMRGRACPNYIISGAASLYVISLTLFFLSSVFSNSLKMIHRGWWYWRNVATQDRLNLSPNTLTASATGRRMLYLSRTRWHITVRINAVILGVHADSCCPQVMALSRTCCHQSGPKWTRMPYITYCSRRYVAGCCTASDSPPRVPCYL